MREIRFMNSPIVERDIGDRLQTIKRRFVGVNGFRRCVWREPRLRGRLRGDKSWYEDKEEENDQQAVSHGRKSVLLGVGPAAIEESTSKHRYWSLRVFL